MEDAQRRRRRSYAKKVPAPFSCFCRFHFPALYSIILLMKTIVIGTAGHIDHGKTALIKALTGIDCDRLKEEKERGITIEWASLTTASATISSSGS